MTVPASLRVRIVFRRVLLASGEWLLFLALAVGATWPLARSATFALPLGTETPATVPLFNLWTVWWNADRAAHLFDDYWQAPIFHPTPDAFAFSEAQPTTLAVAPLVWLCDSPLCAYNAYLLLALTLNGWCACRLFRGLGLGAAVSLLGGAMVQALPFVHWQLGVLQLVPLAGIIWTFHSLLRFRRRPGPRRGAVFGFCFGVTYLLCNYYGLFLGVLLPVAVVCLLGRRMLGPKTWLGLLAAAGVAGVIVLPVVCVQLRASREHDWKRSEERLEQLSAEPADYTVPPWSRPVPIGELGAPYRRPYWKLGAGLMKLVLAVFGMLTAIAFRRRFRAWAVCLTAVLLAAFLLSQGPKLEFAGVVPYGWLMEFVPGFAQARNVFRFAMFAQLMLVFLAVLGLAALDSAGGWRRVLGRCRRGRAGSPDTSVVAASSRPATETGKSVGERDAVHSAEPLCNRRVARRWSLIGRGLMFAVGVMAVAEAWPSRQPLFIPDSPAKHAAWTAWLKTNTPAGEVIAGLPFPADRSPAAYEATTLWMYRQTLHNRPLINGYSGFFPQTFIDAKEQLQHFPDDESLEALRRLGVGYCVLKQADVPSAWREANSLPAPFRLAFRDERAGVWVVQFDRAK